MQRCVLSNLILFQEPAYCKLSYFEILKICDFENSLKKKKKKKKKKRRGKKKKKKGMGVGEVEPIKTKISGKFELVSRNFKNLSRNFEKMILVTKKRGEEKSPPPQKKE